MNYAIRPWRMEDAPDLADTIGNRNVLRNLRDGIPFPYTVADARDFIGEMLAADPEQVFAFAVTADDRAVGSVTMFRQANVHFRTAELGYYIAEPLWGRGAATFAVRAACAQVFEQTDILRIFAEPFAYNTASCRVLEKCGFLLEGTMRKNAFKDGRILDMKLYALTR